MAAIGRFKGYETVPELRTGMAGFSTFSVAPNGYTYVKLLSSF